MTSSARPNLSGLFNGSTPPQRPSRIADPPPSPRLVASLPIRDAAGDPAPEAGGQPTPKVEPEGGGWTDPVNLVNQYFQFLRTLLDVNQQWALACATAVAGIPRRVGLRR